MNQAVGEESPYLDLLVGVEYQHRGQWGRATPAYWDANTGEVDAVVGEDRDVEDGQQEGE